MIKTYLKGIGLLVGLIFGAGVFVLPFAIVKAGFFWGIVHFVIAFSLIFLMHLLYGKIVFSTPGGRRFTGYVGLLLGGGAKKTAFLVTTVSYCGILLVYGVLGGIFLSNIFSAFGAALSPFLSSILFFLIGGILSYLKLGKIGLINFYLTLPIFVFIIYLFLAALPLIEFKNFSPGVINFSANSSWFLPYGVWLFALMGFSTIPEARDLFSSASFKDFKKLIMLGTILPAVFYWIFIVAIVGVSGALTSNDAFAGIAGLVGERVILLGYFMGFLTVFTSFLALTIDLRQILNFDFKIPRFASWLLAVLPPLTLFILNFQDFTRILSIIGSFGLGFIGIFIILMARKHFGANSDAKGKKALAFVEISAIAAILAAIVYEIVSMIY